MAGDGAPVETLLENDMMMFETLTLDFKGAKQIRLVDAAPDLRDPIIRAVDIEATNGVAHVIDRVLIPPMMEE